MVTGCFCPSLCCCSRDFSCCTWGLELRVSPLLWALPSSQPVPSPGTGLSPFWGHWSMALALPGFSDPSPHLSAPCPGRKPFPEMLHPQQGFLPHT